MSGVKKTNNKIEANYTPANQTIIYIERLENPRSLFNNFENADMIMWSKYQIRETDMRVKTATFTSNSYFDLTTGTFAILITSPFHEDFGGIILNVEKDEATGLYNYQCQDFTRQYQGKNEAVLDNTTLHRLLKHFLSDSVLSITGDIKELEKKYKNYLSGLRPAYQYEQKYWGSIVNFNPMTQSCKSIIKGKSTIEIIRDFVFGSGAYIDVYTNKYGVLQIEPYHKKDWLQSNVTIPFEEIQDIRLKFDTTNIITSVNVLSKDDLSTGEVYTAKKLVNIDLGAFFGNQGESIQNPNTEDIKIKKDSSTSTAKNNTNNPYNTKKKNIYLNSDNIHGKSTDRKFLEDIGKALKKQGWKYKVVGVGPNTHTETYAKKYKNGVWFCVYGGADGAVFRECSKSNSYTNTLKKNNLRTVIGMKQGCDIRKGGKCYKWLQRAHDDNYSPSSYKGISYPLDMLTKAKVPIMYAGTVDKMVAKFLAGGDNPKAC